MTRILVVSAQVAMRERIIDALQGVNRPVVAVPLRQDVGRLLDNIRQVLVYATQQGGDVGWLAEQMEQHTELRVVYLSDHPWVSLNYDRARCLIAPHSPEVLNVPLLRRMIFDLLAPGPSPNA